MSKNYIHSIKMPGKYVNGKIEIIEFKYYKSTRNGRECIGVDAEVVKR